MGKAKSEIGSRNVAYKELIKWYDGYRFTLEGQKAEKVFNPVSVLKSLRYKEFGNFWSSTGSMDYVIEEFWNKGGQYHIDHFTKNYAVPLDSLTASYDPTKSPIPLPVWMLSYGYATIVDYHPDKGEVFIKYPNEEIKNATYEKMLKYVPSLHKSIEQCTKETNDLQIAFEQGIVEFAIKNLREFNFYAWPHPSNAEATPPEITRRLNTIFNASRLNFVEGVDFRKDPKLKDTAGDIDFLIRDLPVDYLISVKCNYINPEKRGFAAMQQLLTYTREFPVKFWETVSTYTKKPKGQKIYFLSLGFSLESGGQLDDWVFIPFQNTAPLIDDIKVDIDKPQLKQRIIDYLNSQ